MIKNTFLSFIITFSCIASAFFISQVLYIDRDSQKSYELIKTNLSMFEQNHNIKVISGTYDKKLNKLYCLLKQSTGRKTYILRYAVFYSNGFYYMDGMIPNNDNNIDEMQNLANKYNIRTYAINFRLNFYF